MSTIIRGGLIARNRSPLIQADGLREFLKWKQENVREAAIAGPYGNYRAGQQLFTLPDFHLCDSYVGCSPLSAHQVPHLVLGSCFPTALTCMWLWYKSQPQWHTQWQFGAHIIPLSVPCPQGGNESDWLCLGQMFTCSPNSYGWEEAVESRGVLSRMFFLRCILGDSCCTAMENESQEGPEKSGSVCPSVYS